MLDIVIGAQHGQLDIVTGLQPAISARHSDQLSKTRQPFCGMKLHGRRVVDGISLVVQERKLSPQGFESFSAVVRTTRGNRKRPRLPTLREGSRVRFYS